MYECIHLDYPDNSLFAFLASNAKRYPDNCALEYFGARMSYQRLIREIDICANALSGIGIRQGDVVSLCLPNIPQAVIAFYAINRIGAVANMIHPLCAENEIVHALTLTKSRVILALDMVWAKLSRILDQGNLSQIVLVSVKESMPFFVRTAYSLSAKKVKNVPDSVLSWKRLLSHAVSGAAPNHRGKGGDVAAILYSGGTTGKPKGILLTNLNFNALALQSIAGCGCLCAGDRLLSVMPIFHGFGLGVCIHTALNFGATAIILPKFKAAEFHKLLLRYRPNIVAGVPAIYESLLRSKGFGGKDLSFLKCVISGGDSLSPSTKQKLDRLLEAHGSHARVREGYGLTECVTGSCLMPEHCTVAGTVGLPYADTYYKIVHPDTQEELPFGETGEIILRGPSVMRGYLNEPEETRLALRRREDGHLWLHTGDLGYQNEDGYLFFRQRRKRMIVSGGYNIYPQNIEDVIQSHPSVLMCAVVGIPDPIMGQRAKAFVLLSPDAPADDLKAELLALCRKSMATYALPYEIAMVPELPKTLVGKIAYNELIHAQTDGRMAI